MITNDNLVASPFDEQWYLRRYPDVALAIERGKVPSALEHYNRHGRDEGRHPTSTSAGSGSLAAVRPKSYQTFPGEEGDSDSQRKLRCLRLPSFAGKSVLDIGCNEGFFCFEAVAGGAARVVGLDRNPDFIARAQYRKIERGLTARVDFICQTWDTLPDGKFDVIFLLSALHYAQDQQATICRLTERLTPNGLLVLECGVVEEEHSAIVSVPRSVDVASFPTFGRMKEWLAPFAWKLMGASVQQKGDPIPRKVFHVQTFKREVILLLGSGHTGKTTFARILAKPGIPNIMIDDHVRVYYNTRLNESKLSSIIRTHYDGQHIDHLYKQIVAGGALDDLADDIASALDTINAPVTVVEGALGDDLVIRARVARRLEDRGYFIWLCSRP